jgi:hypothetical protein
MGIVRSAMKKLVNDRRQAVEDAQRKKLEDEARQIERMREIVAGLLPDQDFLRRLQVTLVDPESGEQLSATATHWRGLTAVDDRHDRFNDVTIGYDSLGEKFYLIEWRRNTAVASAGDPFEVQRLEFEEAKNCLEWLAQHIHTNIDPQVATNAIEQR